MIRARSVVDLVLRVAIAAFILTAVAASIRSHIEVVAASMAVRESNAAILQLNTTILDVTRSMVRSLEATSSTLEAISYEQRDRCDPID